MQVSFDVGGKRFAVPERQATILADNLRVLASTDFGSSARPAALPPLHDDWRPGANELADEIERVLAEGADRPLMLDGGAADATYCVLRLMVGLDAEDAVGLRNALGTPVAPTEDDPVEAPKPASRPDHLSRPELTELLVILFVLAVLTVVLGIAWTRSWYVLAPVIAALLGLRVATTRTSGRFAWSFASVLWFGALLLPAVVLVALAALLVAAIIQI